MKTICPFFKEGDPLCCVEDQAHIMDSNFKTIDSVFGSDVPMCAVNLKKMWCHFTCNLHNSRFVNGTGYKQQTVLGETRNLTKISFSVDEGMACDLFRSCRSVSLIAQASI